MNEVITALNIATLDFGYRIMPSANLHYYGWDIQELVDGIWKTIIEFVSDNDKDYPQKSLHMVFAYVLACIKSDIQQDFAQFIADDLYERVRNR